MVHRPLLDSSPAKIPGTHGMAKYSKLQNIPDSPDRQFLQQTMLQQHSMMRNQDEQLDLLGQSVGNLKSVSEQINTELDEQHILLDDFSHELEMTESKLDATMKKMAKVLRMNSDSRQWFAIGVLSAIFIVLLFLLVL